VEVKTVRVVITGASGQLGKACADVFRAVHWVYPDVILLTRKDFDLARSSKDIQADVINLKPDVVINAAAYTAVDKAENELSLAYQVNGTAVGAISDACQKIGAFLFHISTDYVFDVNGSGPHTEHERPNPGSVYGKSKYVGETYVVNNPMSMIVRTSWLYGEGHNFFTSVLRHAAKGETVTVVNDQVGRPTCATSLAIVLAKLANTTREQELPKVLHVQDEGSVVSRADLARYAVKSYGLTNPVKGVSTDEYSHLVDKKLATRPKNSVFDLSLLHMLGINTLSWQSSIWSYLNIEN
jgi:dTDP-4-dehydrorhamnose reductase